MDVHLRLRFVTPFDIIMRQSGPSKKTAHAGEAKVKGENGLSALGACHFCHLFRFVGGGSIKWTRPLIKIKPFPVYRLAGATSANRV